MTITPQPIVNQISLLTYNTHLFEDSLGIIGAKLKHKVVVAADDARRTELVNRIKKLHPDIVCLQEVWAKKWQLWLKQELIDIYPHVYIVPDKGLGLIRNAVTATSGLMVASQYPIQKPLFKIYTDLTKEEDQWAKKGVLTFSISFPISPTKSTTVKIGTTHCPTDIGDAQEAVKIAARRTFGDGQIDSILAGDFNLHFRPIDCDNKHPETTEYDNLKATMKNDHNADDVVQLFFKNDLEKSYTNYGGNKLKLALKQPKSESKDRIDYVYFAKGSKVNHLKPSSAEVFNDSKAWKVDGLDVSDHYPVFVKFAVI